MTKFTLIVATILISMGLLGGVAVAETLAAPQGAARADAVAEVLAAARIEDLVNIVATEGARHGLGLERSLFPGEGGGAWATAVSAIQSPERLAPLIGAALRARLSDGDARDVAAFFRSGLGHRIVASEVAARRDMLDGPVTANARGIAVMMAEADDARVALIDEMMDRLGLVAANVSGGLNANLAFYRGLGDGGALGNGLTEGEMIAMVGSQEADVRRAMTGWLRGYMMLAYRPFTDAELLRYMSFAETDAGRRYASAMFAGFGSVFERTSYDLGKAAARFMAQDAI